MTLHVTNPAAVNGGARKACFSGENSSSEISNLHQLPQQIRAFAISAAARGEYGDDLDRLAVNLARHWRRRWSEIGGAQ